MLQAVVMLMLVIRLVSHLVVQPRLSIIASTLIAASSDIAHLLLGPLAVTCIMIASIIVNVFYFMHVGSTMKPQQAYRLLCLLCVLC
jgi:hypothetical protein